MISIGKIERLEYYSFINAIRLHYDSIKLYKLRSYPSAYFFSVVAKEELGRSAMLSNYIFHSGAEGRLETKCEIDFLGLLYSHPAKQMAFYSYLEGPTKYGLRMMKEVHDGKRELEKQNAIYVGLPKKQKTIQMNGHIKHPALIRSAQARGQINDFHDVVLGALLRQKYEGGFDNGYIAYLVTRSFLKRFDSVWQMSSKRKTRKVNEIKRLLRYRF